MTEGNSGDRALSDKSFRNLRALRRALLNLHKAILEVERTGYERVFGRVGSSHALLQLVMRHPWFGWFRPISEIVVQIDEMVDGNDPLTNAHYESLVREVRSLLNPSTEGEEFGVKYHDILQQDPGVILAHAEITRILQQEE